MDSRGIGNQARHKGKEYCDQWEGSQHYIEQNIEPLDIIINQGWAEAFCKANIIKYTMRCKGPEDVKKIADYAHILAGLLLAKQPLKKGDPQ